METDLRIGLALSGGGARGAAHVGMLRALLEEGIVPRHVTGVSAGAIVGSLYAAGCTPDEIMDFAISSSLRRFVTISLPTKGLIRLDYLKERLTTLIPDNSFDGLQHRLHIGITNLNSGKLELRDSGPLHDIVAASCSIPLMFKPVMIDEMHYVDGGVVKNMPVQPLLPENDFIIGSNLMPYANLAPTDVGTVVGIVWRCFDIGIVANTQPSAELCDIVIEPGRLNDYNIFNLNRLTELHDLGYEETRQRMPEIKERLAMKRELLQELQ